MILSFAFFQIQLPNFFSSLNNEEMIASSEVWTHNPWFTRPVLYHWAIEASDRLLIFCEQSNEYQNDEEKIGRLYLKKVQMIKQFPFTKVRLHKYFDPKVANMHKLLLGWPFWVYTISLPRLWAGHKKCFVIVFPFQIRS